MKKENTARIYFADAAYEALESKKTLPNKFKRMLDRLELNKKVKNKSVAIKMHFGGNVGFTTIHPVFIRILVQALKEAGATSIKAMDSDPEDGIARGYIKEVLGCDVVSCFGEDKKYLVEEKINYKTLDSVMYGKTALDCDFFIDLSHVKAHGACGFGGALKNIAMGMIPGISRQKLHGLEGGMEYDEEKCTYCKKCYEECKNAAIFADNEGKKVKFFLHNCTFCKHCVLICPQKAIKMGEKTFEDFAMGMALVTSAFLKKFKPENTLFINILTNITIFCDCWGMSTPSLVPDIGIMASNDIAAIDKASLDLIKTENLMEIGMPKGRKLLDIEGHLFERIHNKNPYLMVNYLKQVYGGDDKYELIEIK